MMTSYHAYTKNVRSKECVRSPEIYKEVQSPENYKEACTVEQVNVQNSQQI